MYWNYRLVHHNDDGLGREYYTINRVYYEELENPKTINLDPAYATAFSKEELREKLQRMLASLDAPEVEFKSN